MSATYISASLRRDVIQQGHNCCEYCRIHQDNIFFALEIDHIIAEKHGGETALTNLSLACPDCNAFKGSDIASVDWHVGEMIVGLFHPRKYRWDEHFEIDMQTGRILPLTPEGRVTVFLLRLNDPERITDRYLLILEGRYPC
ncbi:MAG: HNH endonuclease signature motif containing protein [Phototrophicales bacterium]|nr:HNH endonuclease signature motif containing protein [Phototrophicales bacterium]